MHELDDDLVQLLDDLGEFVHSCEDDDDRHEVRRRLVLVCNALAPIPVRLSGNVHEELD